jgi:hypothetical protein
MIKPRQALFKWRHFEPEIITPSVGICGSRFDSVAKFSFEPLSRWRDVEKPHK